MKNQKTRVILGSIFVVSLLVIMGWGNAFAQIVPGVQGPPPRAGGPIAGLTAREQAFFELALDVFSEEEGVDGGLGPRFNLDSCAGCHAQPAIGGTSPAINPQVVAAN